MGSTYTYLDISAVPSQRYVYRLEVLDTRLNVSASSLLIYWPYTILLPLLVH